MFENYRYINCFIPSKGCKLTGKQIQLYSYLAYQSQFTRPKTKKGLAAYLCVSQGGVADMLEVLAGHGLYDPNSGNALNGQPTWFHPIKTADHWCGGYMYWKCLVRCPASSLSFGETTVLSYLWHWTDTKKQPKWTVRYIAGGTGLSERIVQESLAALKQKWLVDLSGSELTLYTIPADEQAVYFVPKDEPSPSVVTVRERPADAPPPPPRLQPVIEPVTLDITEDTKMTIDFFINQDDAVLTAKYGKHWDVNKSKLYEQFGHTDGVTHSHWGELKRKIIDHLDTILSRRDVA